MSEPRVKCKKCRASILVVTAEANGGYCGQCARKAQEKEHRKKAKQKEKERNRAKACEIESKLNYDIDKLLKSDDFISEIYTVLPEPCYDELVKLFPEERVVRDLAEFHIRNGGGFTTMVFNCHYEVLENTWKASKKIENQNLIQGMTELFDLFRENRFPKFSNPARCEGRYDTLMADESSGFSEKLEALEEKYFNMSTPLCLRSGDWYADVKRYTEDNIEIFRKRKHPQREFFSWIKRK